MHAKDADILKAILINYVRFGGFRAVPELTDLKIEVSS
jgi:hypothetical protein